MRLERALVTGAGGVSLPAPGTSWLVVVICLCWVGHPKRGHGSLEQRGGQRLVLRSAEVATQLADPGPKGCGLMRVRRPSCSVLFVEVFVCALGRAKNEKALDSPSLRGGGVGAWVK